MTEYFTGPAPCGCDSVLRHNSCRLVRNVAHENPEEDPKIHCDAEDGGVWIHLFGHAVRKTPAETRSFEAELELCARAAEKNPPPGGRKEDA